MQNTGELLKFLRDIHSDLRGLRILIDHKRNTLKIKTFDTFARMLQMRVEAYINLIKGGDDSEHVAPLLIQSEIFKPCVEYMAKELGVDEENL